MHRRQLIGTGLVALASPRIARAQAATTLRFVPQADLALLDPIQSTGFVTRNHAFLVFDTLYGWDEQYRVQPQMVEGHRIEDAGLTWLLTLRDGLRFHDGQPVLARDCVASLRRWGTRDSFGLAVMGVTDEVSAPDDRTIRWRLKRPFPLLADALGKPGANVAFMMPERLAKTDSSAQVPEMVGSGPYRFVADERLAGSRTVYARFDGYRPRQGAPSMLAGGKVAQFDRVEWLTIPDPATAAAALQRGEVDWWEQPIGDLLPSLRRTAGLKVELLDATGAIGMFRFNHLHPPFDNPAIRRALLPVFDQTACMQAIVGTDPALWRDKVGFFTPGSVMASDEGMAALTSPRDPLAAKRALAAAGYKNEPVTMLAATDYPAINAMCEVSADMLRQAGMMVDYQAMDWGSVLRRTLNRDPPDKGGFNAFCTFTAGVNQFTPAAHNFIRGSGLSATPGWSTSAGLEALRTSFFDAPDDAARAQIGRDMQRQAFVDMPYVPLGQFFQPTAYRATLSGILKGPPLFWNVRRG